MTQTVQLLQQIADNTSHNNTILLAIIAGASGVLGAAAGAFSSFLVGLKAANTQVKIEEARLLATVVTSERLRWLQDIRNRLANIYRLMDMQYSYLKRSVESEEEKRAYQEKQDELSSQIMEHQHLITLMLNPKKPDQLELREALQSQIHFITHCWEQRNQGNTDFNDSQYEVIKISAFNALTEIGIKTWDRIQTLK